MSEDTIEEEENSKVPAMSLYEKRRLENIKKNNAKLRALGLISILEEMKSNSAAAGFHIEESEPKRKRKKLSVKTEPREGSRKSLRLQGIPSEEAGPIRSESIDRESVLKERQERVKECREARLRAAKAVAESGAEAAAKNNPTATYGHCLMRVKSMSEKGLANRVKAIERAAGKHCVVKMAIFKSCLQDEGLWSLADLASEALERLKELKPIPDE